MRKLGTENSKDHVAFEPYCKQCVFNAADGQSYCVCGLTLAERKDSGWEFNGEKNDNKH